MNTIEFGHFIEQKRKAAGLTQKELAEKSSPFRFLYIFWIMLLR